MSANPGTTISACSIFVRNPRPISEAATRGQDGRARSTERVSAYTAPISTSVSGASGLLNRKISTATGVNARMPPASRPAAGPNQRLTAAYSNATDATPSSACGTRMLHELTPKRRAEMPITHSDAGGLSTVMKFDESNDPKKNAFQLLVDAWTAA